MTEASLNRIKNVINFVVVFAAITLAWADVLPYLLGYVPLVIMAVVNQIRRRARRGEPCGYDPKICTLPMAWGILELLGTATAWIAGPILLTRETLALKICGLVVFAAGLVNEFTEHDCRTSPPCIKNAVQHGRDPQYPDKLPETSN